MTPPLTPEQRADAIVRNSDFVHGGVGQHPKSDYCRNCLRDAIIAALRQVERETWEKTIRWLQEFSTRKPTIEELEFILEQKGGGPQVQIQPDETVLMNESAIISLALREFRRRSTGG